MREVLSTAIVFVLLLLGFALLALSQERHQERVFESNRQQLQAYRTLRAIGLSSVALALPLCVLEQGGGFGSLLWLVLMSAAAMATALLLTWRPQWLRWLKFFWLRVVE